MDARDGTGSTEISDTLRRAMEAASAAPLWESPTAHKLDDNTTRPQLWPWRVMKELVAAAMDLSSPKVVERRVLSLVGAKPRFPGDQATMTTLNAALQILLPGEAARPHRHSMNALRFVLEGEGASTIVDGKDCPMAEGDLVITPAWTWHEHVHRGDKPIVWLDALDVAFHEYLGTAEFQPGPARNVPRHLDDAAFAAPNIVPEWGGTPPKHSPVFRYPWADAVRALAAAPPSRDGARDVHYVNPLTGGSAMQLLDCSLIGLDGGTETVAFRTNSNAVAVVAEGRGTSRIGGTSFAWEPRDIFTLPRGHWITHKAEGDAKLFISSDRDMLRRLDILVEEFGAA